MLQKKCNCTKFDGKQCQIQNITFDVCANLWGVGVDVPKNSLQHHRNLIAAEGAWTKYRQWIHREQRSKYFNYLFFFLHLVIVAHCQLKFQGVNERSAVRKKATTQQNMAEKRDGIVCRSTLIILCVYCTINGQQGASFGGAQETWCRPAVHFLSMKRHGDPLVHTSASQSGGFGSNLHFLCEVYAEFFPHTPIRCLLGSVKTWNCS